MFRQLKALWLALGTVILIILVFNFFWLALAVGFFYYVFIEILNNKDNIDKEPTDEEDNSS